MNKEQINKKETIDSVISFLDANAAVWTSIAKVGFFANELKAVQKNIIATASEQAGAKVYLGKTKQQLKLSVAEKADIVNDIVECFAALAGDAVLEQKMSDSKWSLNRMRNEDFVMKVDEILQAAEKHKEVLIGEYGLTQEQLTDLMTDTNEFNEIRGEPRAYKIASTQATGELETLFATATDIMNNKLDKVMKIFTTRDPKFYQGYRSARVIVD